MKWLNHVSYYFRIQLILVIFIILPLIVASLISYNVIKHEITDRYRQSNEQVMRVINSKLTQAIDDVSFSANFFASDVAVHNTLNILSSIEGLESFEEHQAIRRLNEIYNLLDVKTLRVDTKMVYLNTQGYMITNDAVTANMNSNGEYGTNSIWNEIEHKIDFNNSQTMQWIGFINGLDSDYYAARILKHKVTKENLGVLIIAISRQFFLETFALTINGNLIIYDSNGVKIGEHNNFDAEPVIEITDELKVDRLHWKLVYEIPTQVISGQILSVFRFFFIFIAVIVVLFIVLSIVTAKSLHKPIFNFKKIAQKFGSGDLSARFPVKGKDEMAVLGNAFNKMLDQIEELVQKIEWEQEEKRIIELQAMFAQIRPHFLINTLNSFKCELVIDGEKQRARKLEALISLLRAYMKVHAPCPLKEECKLLDDYVEIMKLRNDMEIEFVRHIPKQWESFEVPRLLLQPLVENSIVHGFEKNRKGKIELHVEQQEKYLVLHFSDNGKGMDEEQLQRLHQRLQLGQSDDSSTSGIGLINVQQRMKLSFGSRSELKVYSSLTEGTVFEMWLLLDESIN